MQSPLCCEQTRWRLLLLCAAWTTTHPYLFGVNPGIGTLWTGGIKRLAVWRPVVALYTTRFNIQQLYVLPTQYICVFVWISEQTALISLYSINWLVCITETECIYCAVRAESLNNIHITCSLQGRAMAWELSIRHINPAVQVPFHVSPCGIFDR